MNLTTKELVRLYLSDQTLSETAEALIVTLIVEVSKRAEIAMDRSAETTTYTETFDVPRHCQSVQLKAWPITSITSAANDTDRGYAAATYVDSDDYSFTEYGRLCFDFDLAPGRQALRVIYVGGMATTTDLFVSTYPDVAGALARQVVHEFRRRGSLAADTISLGAGGSLGIASQVDWLNFVEDVLMKYRRADL